LTEGNPQEPPVTMESMEEDNQNEEEVVTTSTIKPMVEVLGELGCEVSAEPQEPTSTLGPNIEYPYQFSFFSLIPRGARRTCSLRHTEEDLTIPPILSQKPQLCGVDDTQIDKLVGEHLARTPPVVERMQQEEIDVGEEEGPSEAVPMNEPMEEPGEKVVRLPVKQKHQPQFKETMKLKMKVRKLRK
jgi:hypothetical protein